MHTHICECIARCECVSSFILFFSVFFLVAYSLFLLAHANEFGLLNKTKKERKKSKEKKTSDSLLSVCVRPCVRVGMLMCVWFLLVFVKLFFFIIFVICLCSCRHFIIFVVCCNTTISYRHTQRSCATDSSRKTLSICCFVSIRSVSVSFFFTWTVYLQPPLVMSLSMNFNFFFSICASLSIFRRVFILDCFLFHPASTKLIVFHTYV